MSSQDGRRDEPLDVCVIAAIAFGCWKNGCGVRCGAERNTIHCLFFARRSIAFPAAGAGAVQTRNTASAPATHRSSVPGSVRSPRLLAGLACMFNGFGLVLAPQFASELFMIMAGPVFFGETSFALWLLIKGVRIENWRALIGAVHCG